MDNKKFANLQGAAAVLFWSFSALNIGWTGQAPPFLVAALSAMAGFCFFLPVWGRDPRRLGVIFKQAPRVWLLFFLSVIPYRAFQLTGLKLAPLVEANLLNFLWPLMIVLAPALFEGRRLSRAVVVGALLSFGGVACIGVSKQGFALSFEVGHLYAATGAVLWAAYSLLTRRFPAALPDTAGIMHLVAIPVFLSLHVAFEPPTAVASLSALNWCGVAGLGLSVSWGYYLWDRAMTNGDSEKVAVFAYFAPLLSTLWLVLFGAQAMTPWVWAAVVLIIGGSLVARFSRS